jgi:hypothetical protein
MVATLARAPRRHVKSAPERGDPCHKGVGGATCRTIGGAARVTGSPKDQQKQSRTRRLSTALRDNLKRRKAQARGRKAGERGGPDQPSTETHDSAGFGRDKQNR